MKNQDLEPTWNGYLFRLQQEAPQPKPVICRCKKTVENGPRFYGNEYHGSICREEAESLCDEEGTFLIRESQTEPGRFVLVLRLLDNVKNFKLYYENGKHFVGDKRFDSVYSLVEDGLITMYVDCKAKDFIKTMPQRSVYNSLSRYSSLGNGHDASGRISYRYAGQPCHVESIGCMNDAIEARQCGQRTAYCVEGQTDFVAHLDGHICDFDEAHFGPGYVPRTVLESGCYPHRIADVHYLQNTDFNHAGYQEQHLESNHALSEWRSEVQRAPETIGGHKKMLTPTSSDERRRTKKRIATEDCISMRATSNGVQMTSPKQSPTKLTSAGMMHTSSFQYQNVEDANCDRFLNSQYFDRSPQIQLSLSNVDPKPNHIPQRVRDVTPPAINAKMSSQKNAILNVPHKDFGHSQNFVSSGSSSCSLSSSTLDAHKQTSRCSFKSKLPDLHSMALKLKPVENLYQHERTDSSLGSCESGMSNLSSMERSGTASSRRTHDSHLLPSEDDISFSGHHRAIFRGPGVSPLRDATVAKKILSKSSEAKSPWRRRSEVEENVSRKFSASFNTHLLQFADETSVFSSSLANSETYELKRISRELKRERRNSFDTSSLSRTHNISIHPVVEPKPAFDRVTSATPGHPAAQKSKTKAILRRVSSLGLSRKGSPSNALSRKGSLKEKSNKSKQTEETKNRSPTKFKKSDPIVSSHQPEITSPLHNPLSVLSSSVKNNEAQGIARQYEKKHQYKSFTYRGFQWCEYCGNFMWGIIQQGVQCRDCGLNVHKQCSKVVPNDCQPALKHVKRVFGVDLTTLVKLHCTQRPLVVDMCIDEVEKKGLNSEGIYRIPGCHDDVMIVKAAFDEYGQNVDLSTEQDINTIAGVLKLYLRELPVPLIPYELYSRFINAAKLTHNDGKLNAFRMGLSAMPEAHFETLKHLVFHLGKVSDSSVLNHMSANNLGVVFGPTLLRAPIKSINTLSINDTHYQQQAVETMIEFRHILFR